MADPTTAATVPGIYADALTTLELSEKGPREPALGGAPVEFFHEWHDDGRARTGVWECTPGSFESARDGVSEVMHFIAGEATIIDDDNTVHEIRPGTVLVVPDGWRGVWHIRETVRKVYTLWSTAPRDAS
jgi:uncharacterized cupin superfamily protein